MEPSNHPYKMLPANKFWKTSVDDVTKGALRDLWIPKFPITMTHRVITVGSCFAQHISKHLMQAGFSWIDSEPAPTDLPVEQWRAQGYGVFSFRTGNIYTPALLEQWIDMSLGKIMIGDEVFCAGNKYFDPLRPNIPADGFDSQAEMLRARQNTSAAIRAALNHVDIFVFTLGLTEAWQHRDGHVYPMCPGTIQGDFLPETHLFHNYTYDEIVASLTRTFASIRAINPTVRFLLTVSPVPLTATASKDHILTATTYSKSVLRAAAGFIADHHADVDYFPSYELITSPLFKGRFYEENLRSVTGTGVQFVMQHFLSAVGVVRPPMAVQSSAEVPQKATPPAQAAKTEDEICEDIILEQWSKQECVIPADTEKVIMLMGDSHMGMLGEQMSSAGIPFIGGAFMSASQWDDAKFTLDAHSLFILSDADAQERWLRTLTAAKTALARVDAKKMTIITNIGMHTQRLCNSAVIKYLRETYGEILPEPAIRQIISLILNKRSAHLSVVQHCVAAGHQVICLSDPPVPKGDDELFAMFDDLLCIFFKAVGAKSFNARQWVATHGGWSAHLRSDVEEDDIHGSAEYYRVIFQAMASYFA